MTGKVASNPGQMGGEKRPGIDCLCMCDHSQKKLGVCLCLEIVGKIYVHVRYITVSSKDVAVCQ